MGWPICAAIESDPEKRRIRPGTAGTASCDYFCGRAGSGNSAKKTASILQMTIISQALSPKDRS
jgi:hypothetical protein